jgi:hypothetical protein
MKALAVGGMPDHLHLLLSLPPNVPVSTAVQLVKAGSSKWMHEQQGTRFEWQVGYGAFTIGVSQIPANCQLHPQSGEASCKKELCARMENILEEARVGRGAGPNSAVPAGTHNYFLC